MTQKISIIFFSPTGTTKKMTLALGKGIADALGAGIKQTIDLRYPSDRALSYSFTKDDILVMGLPVYEGRVIPITAEVISRMKGDSTPAVIAMMYGNRAFEDALLEMKNLLEASGFKVFTAGAFIGEHSSNAKLGTGRPDESDMKIIADFANKSAQKLRNFYKTGEYSPAMPSGNFPYQELRLVTMLPTVTDLCTKCMICVDVCPTQSINRENPKEIADSCIKCKSCIKSCPENAITYTSESREKLMRWLERNHSARKEPETFL